MIISGDLVRKFSDLISESPQATFAPDVAKVGMQPLHDIGARSGQAKRRPEGREAELRCGCSARNQAR